jgi:hypothetical protein
MNAWIVGLHLWSSHFGACYDLIGECKPYESATVGIYAKAPGGFTFGAYRNSYGKPSAYAGWTFETKDRRFALVVAGITGYDRATVVPAVVPSVRFYLGGHTALRIAGLPRFEKGGASVLHFALERSF